MRKSGVEPKPRHHDADAVRPDHTQEMGLCCLERSLLQRLTPLTEFAKAGRNDYGSVRAPRRQFDYHTRNRLGRCDNDREIRSSRKACNIRVNNQSFDAVVMGVDQHQLAGKPGTAKVAQDYRADRAGARRCADQRHRSRREQLVEVANGHGLWAVKPALGMRFSDLSEKRASVPRAGLLCQRPACILPASSSSL